MHDDMAVDAHCDTLLNECHIYVGFRVRTRLDLHCRVGFSELKE